MRDPDLWHRLQAHEIDDPAAERPYSERLRRAAGLSARKVEAVIAEYRRFLYLCTISPERLSPPPAVDAAWHLHLTYTRDYWERLPATLRTAPPHHEPATGPADDARHAAQYDRTRKLYAEEFGAPPASLWPGKANEASTAQFLGIGAGAGAVAAVLIVGGAAGFGAFVGVVAAVLLTLGLAKRAHLARGGVAMSVVVALGGDGDGGDGGGCGD